MNVNSFFLFLCVLLCVPLANALTVSDGVIFSSHSGEFVFVHNQTQQTGDITVSDANIIVNSITYNVNAGGNVVLIIDNYSAYKYRVNDTNSETVIFTASGSGKPYALLANTYYNFTTPDVWSLHFDTNTVRLWLTDGGTFRALLCPTTTGDSLLFIATMFFFLLFVGVAALMGEPLLGIFGSIGLICVSWVVAMCSGLLGSVFVAISIGFLLHFVFVRKTPS